MYMTSGAEIPALPVVVRYFAMLAPCFVTRRTM
jgi:hypothetical protein